MSDSWPPSEAPGENTHAANGEKPIVTDGLPDLPPNTAPLLEERPLRPRQGWWDHSKFLLGSIALWWILVWGLSSNNPIEPFGTVLGHELRTLGWLEVLFALELLRQINYLISERSRRWHYFFSERIFGGLRRETAKISDWTRYRIARVARVVVFLVLLAVILAAFFHTSPITSLYQVPAAVVTAAPLIVQLFFYMGLVVMQFVAIFWFMSRGGVDVYYPGDVKTRFSDVWGQDAVLSRVQESIIFLQDPEAIEQRGGYVPGGILLWGPPGTGKTLIAEAVAGETHNPFVFVDPGAFQNMFMGVGILKVKGLFRKLRRLAVRYGGVVVFFDEADSLGNRGSLSPGGIFGPNRAEEGFFSHHSCNSLSYLDPNAFGRLLTWSQAGHEEEPPRTRSKMMAGAMGGGGQGTLQSLLAEMSGLKKPRGFVNRVVRRALGMQPKSPPKYRIMVMMATNMPQSLDEALLRPGRIDRIYKVGYPSKAGRLRTYEGYFSKVAHSLRTEDIDKLATITPYATGATIKDLVNESLINAIRDGRDIITWGDVIKAKQLKDLGPPEDVEYIERERHAVAIHEACHAVVAARVRKELTIDIATIEKGGSYLGMVSSVRVEDTFTTWKSDFEADIMVALASLAGEKMFFKGDNSSGVSGDLRTATYYATAMEGSWGMGETVSVHEVTNALGVPGGPSRERGESRQNQIQLGGRIERRLIDLLQRVAELIEQNRREVLAVAHALEKHKTITGDDVIAIIEGREGSFVDGRKYQSAEFMTLAEDYHKKVLEAHLAHGTVDIAFPELPEFESQPELVGATVIANGSVSSAPLADSVDRVAPSPGPNGAAGPLDTTVQDPSDGNDSHHRENGTESAPGDSSADS